MELYLKQYTSNEFVLQKYEDYSRKIIALKKKNNKAMLAKVYPTSKQLLKFTLQSEMEVNMEVIPALINALQPCVSKSNEIGSLFTGEQCFIIIDEYENYKKEKMRVVLRSTEYGGGELAVQKLVVELPDEDMVFETEEAALITDNADEMSDPTVYDNWVDEWGSFFFKRNDNMREICSELNKFYHAVKGNASTGARKRKPKEKGLPPKKKGRTEPDPAATTTTVNTDECEYLWCEKEENPRPHPAFLLLNKNAFAELLFFHKTSPELSLEDCICRYNDEMNINLNDDDKVDFVNLIRNEGVEDIKQLFKNL